MPFKVGELAVVDGNVAEVAERTDDGLVSAWLLRDKEMRVVFESQLLPLSTLKPKAKRIVVKSEKKGSEDLVIKVDDDYWTGGGTTKEPSEARPYYKDEDANKELDEVKKQNPGKNIQVVPSSGMQATERTREHGTPEVTPDDGMERIKAIRRIVEDGQYAKIDGQMIDLFSASAIVQVYDALSEKNQEKFRSMPAWRMGEVAFKLIDSQKTGVSASSVIDSAKAEPPAGPPTRLRPIPDKVIDTAKELFAEGYRGENLVRVLTDLGFSEKDVEKGLQAADDYNQMIRQTGGGLVEVPEIVGHPVGWPLGIQPGELIRIASGDWGTVKSVKSDGKLILAFEDGGIEEIGEQEIDENFLARRSAVGRLDAMIADLEADLGISGQPAEEPELAEDPSRYTETPSVPAPKPTPEKWKLTPKPVHEKRPKELKDIPEDFWKQTFPELKGEPAKMFLKMKGTMERLEELTKEIKKYETEFTEKTQAVRDDIEKKKAPSKKEELELKNNFPKITETCWNKIKELSDQTGNAAEAVYRVQDNLIYLKNVMENKDQPLISDPETAKKLFGKLRDLVYDRIDEPTQRLIDEAVEVLFHMRETGDDILMHYGYAWEQPGLTSAVKVEAGFWDGIKKLFGGIWEKIEGFWDDLAGIEEAADESDDLVGEFQSLLAEANLRHAGRSLVAGWNR